jgi:hypothetical protein
MGDYQAARDIHVKLQTISPATAEKYSYLAKPADGKSRNADAGDPVPPEWGEEE